MGKVRDLTTTSDENSPGVVSERVDDMQTSETLQQQDEILEPDTTTLVDMFRIVLLSRTLDEAEERLRKRNTTFFHISSAGHEVIQAVASKLFRPGHDWFYLYYRDRCLSLGLGVPLVDMFLQALGKATDPTSGGREMPCHFGTPSLRIINQSSATGSQFLHAVGTAEGIWKARGQGVQPGWRRQTATDGLDLARVEKDEFVLVTGGEGATSEGEFYESVSAACLHRLPVLFLIEDNAYAISVPVEHQTPGGSISRLVKGFPDLLVEEVDGLNPVESYKVLSRAVDHVRRERGPAFVHAHVSRLVPHSDADDDRHYRTHDERELMRAGDPLRQFETLLVNEGHMSEDDLRSLRRDVEAEVEQALEVALAAPDPDGTTVAEFLFAPEAVVKEESEPRTEGDALTLLESIRETLEIEMGRDPRIVLFGEDVADLSRAHLISELAGKGGVFKVTHGLQRKFGYERVFNAPIAEAAIVGRAIGLAVRGFLPVPEIQFLDYIWPAMHQLRNELAVLRWRSYNNFAAPVVLRVPTGGYLRGGGMYHSQSAESILCSCPGLRVVLPSNARDAAGLLRTALRCGDPVVFLEHKHLYRQPYAKAPYPGPDYVIPLGKARTVRPGADLTIVTYGALVEKSLRAARRVEEADGIDTEIIDLRSLQPYDWEAIADSVARTNRVIVAAEEPKCHGFAAEVAARVADELFEHLDAPVRRVGALDVPVPYSPVLEEATLPQEDDLVDAILSLRRY